MLRAWGAESKAASRFIHDGSRSHYPVFPNRAKNMKLDGPQPAVGSRHHHVNRDRLWVPGLRSSMPWSSLHRLTPSGRSIDARLAVAALKARHRRPHPPRVACIIPTAGSNMPPITIAPPWQRDCLTGLHWPRANPTTTPRPDLHEDLKVEAVYPDGIRNLRGRYADLPRFIDEVYNTLRLHSALGYLSPAQSEDHPSPTCQNRRLKLSTNKAHSIGTAALP